MGFVNCVPTCRTDRQCLCDPPYNLKRRKNHSAPGKASRLSYSYQVSGVWYIHNSDNKKNDLEEFC